MACCCQSSNNVTIPAIDGLDSTINAVPYFKEDLYQSMGGKIVTPATTVDVSFAGVSSSRVFPATSQVELFFPWAWAAVRFPYDHLRPPRSTHLFPSARLLAPQVSFDPSTKNWSVGGEGGCAKCSAISVPRIPTLPISPLFRVHRLEGKYLLYSGHYNLGGLLTGGYDFAHFKYIGSASVFTHLWKPLRLSVGLARESHGNQIITGLQYTLASSNPKTDYIRLTTSLGLTLPTDSFRPKVGLSFNLH
eukprot:TRINITY_DN11625_c0_g1_i1.p1 TRINITY_DN11625_c0_g1~~TRINITY_DN11625_c0_g1_i1.p1  ORF type:complete len:290 (+),score=53.17 TRINITY_DN11625_c0_g1_i1:129-872(+)